MQPMSKLKQYSLTCPKCNKQSLKTTGVDVYSSVKLRNYSCINCNYLCTSRETIVDNKNTKDKFELVGKIWGICPKCGDSLILIYESKTGNYTERYLYCSECLMYLNAEQIDLYW